MPGKFELKKGKSGKFMFNLKAVNGQVILTSQAYKTKAAAKNGIKSVCTNCSKDARFEQKASKKGEPYFVLGWFFIGQNQDLLDIPVINYDISIKGGSWITQYIGSWLIFRFCSLKNCKERFRPILFAFLTVHYGLNIKKSTTKEQSNLTIYERKMMLWKISFTVKMILSRFVVFGLILAFSITNAGAADSAINDNRPIAISAEEAFDAFADQIDPKSGESARVVIADIRTKAEYFWVGTSGKVDKIITTSNNVIIPDKGKVKFFAGNYIQAKRSGLSLFLPISRISQMITSPIAINIPCLNWNAENFQLEKNENFAFEIQSLSNLYDVVILMCRSGSRTTACYLEFDNSLFKSVYEIDDSFIGGTGGFQGSSFNNVFNGYRGFPGRNRSSFGFKPISWSDSGLPVHLGYCDF